ncbi:MAG TPA: hypothetical protein VNU70_04555, partial [Puia sp.]|nr:hypothetical protein [Puia sp.]
MQYTRNKNFLLTVYFLFYFFVFLFFGIDYRLLTQVRPVIFLYNRDLAELILIGAGLPRWMIAHSFSFLLTDTIAFLLPAALLFYAFRKGRFSPVLGWAFTLFLTLYLLLADIFWQVHHGPFILYVLLSFAFLTNKQERFYQILSGCRYYFLYIFVSAAVWKIARGAVFHPQEMSRILLDQHSYLLSGDCATWTCRWYSWLIDHPGAAQALYWGAIVLETVFIAGFFTRRFDRLLLVLAILFVIGDLIVMRIPYWTLLLGTVTLWIDTGVRRPVMVIYETTHHENLPALLDLSESRFPRVIVFLREISWQNLSGNDSPVERWPKTEFIVQPAGSPNRPFIRQLFIYLRRQRCSHLHLSTLDNNLLVFALRIGMAGNIRVSLTVHEVNDWFAPGYRSVRDASESLAKLILRIRIGHYTFFLPAMAEAFRRKMARAETVFIPSRFYSGASLHARSSPFTIVIPGSVDGNRRDYEAVVAFFKEWQPPGPLRLVILGNCDSRYGATIIAGLQAVATDKLDLRYYAEYVPESVYEQQLREADLIWSPLRVQKRGSRDTPETYGLTTASGLTADLLLTNIPVLAPAELELPE